MASARLTCAVVQRRVRDVTVGHQRRLVDGGLRDQLEGDVPVTNAR